MFPLQEKETVSTPPRIVRRIVALSVASIVAIVLVTAPALAAVNGVEPAEEVQQGPTVDALTSDTGGDPADGGASTGSSTGSNTGSNTGSSTTDAARATVSVPQSNDVGAAQTASPNASAQSQGSVAEVSLLGEEVIVVSRTRTAAGDGASSEATVVSLLGNDIIGAGSSASGGSDAAETGFLTEFCEQSDGQLCVALLFGHAASSDDATSSESSANTAVFSLCLDGGQGHPLEECDGPVDVGIGETHSQSSVDKAAGESEATHSTSLARACLGGYADDVCDGIGLRLFTSSSHSQASPGQPGVTEADAALITLEAGGDEVLVIDQSQQIAVPPGCPEQSAACIWLNISETEAVTGAAAAEASAVELSVVPPADLLDASVSSGGTAASGAGVEVLGEVIRPEPPRPLVEPLAVTGAGMLTLFALGLLLTAAGVVISARARSGFLVPAADRVKVG